MRSGSLVDRYLFRPGRPEALALCRITFFAWLFLYYLPLVETYMSQGAALFADVSEVFRNRILPTRRIQVPVLPGEWIHGLQVVWKVSLLAACIGFRTRLSMWIAFVLGTYLLGLPLTFGKVDHKVGILAITLGILALSRAGDALSVDAWSRRRRGQPPPPPSGAYVWPIRFVWINMSMLYLCAGVSKLQMTGLAYYDPEIMQAYLLRGGYYDHQIRFTDWGVTLSTMPWVCSAMSAGALLLELAFPFALVSVWARRLLVPAMFLGHIGIAVVLGPRFFQFLAVYVFWVPWDRLLAPVWEGRGAPARQALA